MADIKIPDIRVNQSGSIEEEIGNIKDAYFMMRKWLEYAFSGVLDEENVIRAQEANIANILAGKITADQIDVTNGKIQAAQIETLTVGSNVQMGPNAYISWSNVTNQPFIPATAADVHARPDTWMPTAAEVGALPWNTYIPVLPSYIKSTYIDQTNVISPFISGGVMTGALFRTAASGIRLEMNSSGIVCYNRDNYQDGITIERGIYSYSAIDFYHLGVKVGALEYDGLGTFSLGPQGDAVLQIHNVEAQGSWNFTNANVTGLDNIVAVFG